jgi:hypothetical protein
VEPVGCHEGLQLAKDAHGREAIPGSADRSRWRGAWSVGRGANRRHPEHAGFEIDLVVNADLVALTKAWMGDVRLADAMRSGLVRVEGPTALVRAFPGWLALSGFADVERPRAGAARQPPDRAEGETPGIFSSLDFHGGGICLTQAPPRG